MAFVFSDGFDCYTAPAEAINGYWDSGPNVTNVTLVAGRFAGSRAITLGGGLNAICLVKSSGANDSVHHFNVAYRQTTTITGSSLWCYMQLLDGTTGQCAVVFRSDGAILLNSGNQNGTNLAVYPGALTAANTWYSFEIEIVVHNSTGSFKVRKNGNSVDDHSTTGIDTAGGTANNYANKLQLGTPAGNAFHELDDFYWRSDATTVSWIGEMKCTTRYPASDAGTPQFSRVPTTLQQGTTAFGSSSVVAGEGRYTPFVAAYSGTVDSAVINFATGFTGNLKVTIFASSGGVPTTAMGSTTVVVNPATGNNTVIFSSPATVVVGTTYFVSANSDTASGSWQGTQAISTLKSTTSYASFPASSPVTVNAGAWGGPNINVTVTNTDNFRRVSEVQQDAFTSYVYDPVAGHEDFYGIGTIAGTPVNTIAVVTRAYMIKGDIGTRTAAVQIKSGGTTVASPTLTLTVSGWQWTYRHDTTDPATGTAWTAAAVSAATVGPKVIA